MSGGVMRKTGRSRATVRAMIAVGLAALAPAMAQAAGGPPDCAALSGITLPGAEILSAEPVAAGALRIDPSPVAPDLAARAAGLPAFCRVQAVATPTPNSRIGIEVWLPTDGWNGRFLGTGNGGGAGRIAYEMGMIEGLKRGFAVANTDMGTAPDINLASDHPERWVDFGHRATHEMTRIGKGLVAAFYGDDGFRSYFMGCSTGGQQGLSAAQRHPADYDGILAGDPGNNRTHVASYFLWNYQTLNAAPETALSAAQWSLVSRHVLAACAGKDGGAPNDAFLTDPRRCDFDPASLPVCKAGTGDDCLTGAQVDTLRRLYAGPVNPTTGERIYAGLTPGSEAMPLGPLEQSDPATWPDQQFYPFRWALGEGFDPATFDFDRDLDRVDTRLSSTLNANGADLSDFARAGGKLMIYTGLADPAVPYGEVIDYYDRLSATTGDPERTAEFARLFLVPGMGHCFGGPGATDIGQPFTSDIPPLPENDALMTLVGWVEGGPAPDHLIARRPADENTPAMMRPVCAYPALPEYRGGDVTDPASFACTAQARGSGQPPAPRYLN